MNYSVKHNATLTRKYLVNIARLVVKFVRDTPYFYVALNMHRYCHLVGPDGVLFDIEMSAPDEATSDAQDVFIEEIDPNSVRLLLSANVLGNDDCQHAYPQWVFRAFRECCTEEAVRFVTALYFGQLPLDAAAKLMNVSLAEMKKSIRPKVLEDDDDILNSSVTRIAFKPSDALVDIRGLLAWAYIKQKKQEWFKTSDPMPHWPPEDSDPLADWPERP